MKRKKLLHVIFLSICLVFSPIILASCDLISASKQEQQRKTYGSTLEELAYRFSQEASHIIPPPQKKVGENG